MGILNYTTSVSAERSIAEIQKILIKAKATAVLTEFNDGVISHLSFRLNTPQGLMSFRLPANIDNVHKLLNKHKIEPRFKTKERASWVAWRILKDWVEAQMALIEVEMVTLEQVFLPYAQDRNGQTVYEKFLGGDLKMLT